MKRAYRKYFCQSPEPVKIPKHEDSLPPLFGLFKRAEDRLTEATGISGIQPEQVSPITNINTVMPEEDKHLWQLMFKSQKGEKIKALFNGDTSAYNNDDSRADLALCNYLALWTNSDTVRIDRMFRQSKLMRPKWTQGNNPTYGERTIQTALHFAQELRRITSEVAMSSQKMQDTISTELQPTASSPVRTNNPYQAVDSVLAYLDDKFDEDTKKFGKFSKLKTGFANIDSITSFYPELYFLAAEPGLGKTTFCTQLADQLSMKGEHVLYFSFEQSALELVSKGLSRLTTGYNLNNCYNLMNALTATQVRTLGKSDSRVISAMERYKSFSMNEIFICNVLSIDKVKERVRDYIQTKQVSPIVIVDYLQILQSSEDNKNTTKDVIDSHVWGFKQLQREYDLPIIMISSLNRANYMNAIDMSSMKESGSLEYSAGIIWGLQLKVLHKMNSDKKENAFEKREKIREAKIKIPSDFQYYANYDLFVPVLQQTNTLGAARI